MANTNLTISQVTKESLMILENNLTFAKGVNREYDDQFALSGAKIGDTVNIRKPARYVGRTGAALAVEDHTETSVPLVLDTQFGVDLNFTSKELTLSIDEFSDRIIKPAMAVVANKIDRTGLALYKNIFNAVGTPGTIPTTLKTYLQAGAKMDYEACPRDGQRALVIDPSAQVEIVDSLKGLFHSQNEVSKQYKDGNMGQAGGFMWSMDQNINSHTVGAHGGTPTISGAGQTGAALNVTGFTPSITGVLKAGDIFTVAGVFAVNPQSRESTGQLRQFVVTADANSAVTTGAATLSISPSIVTSGAFQTVNAGPANGAAIVVLGAAGAVSPTHLAYHKNAFVLGSADLLLPKGVDMAARASDKNSGLSVRMVRQYDINNDKFPCRFDVLFGWKTIYAELACRIQG